MAPYRPPRMRFGIFMAPFHRLGENPTVAIERDLELVEHLDRLNFDEAWFGEHHSAGWEIFASPELMIAAAAQRTKTIRLGTGVSSLPYHHPFILADRMLQLDHMTRGRAMFGVGPGALASDAYMLGIDPVTQRPRMEEALGVILALFRGETVTMKTDWFEMREARLQFAPYTYPHMPVAVASTFSPAGPTAAGKHGVGVLSVAASQPGGLIALSKNWEIAEQAAAAAGKTVSRDDWRLSIPFHLADTRDEAFAQATTGFHAWAVDYFQDTLGHAADPTSPGTLEAMAERGGAIIGTPDDAIEAIERLIEMSGGFGCLLGMAHDWASWEQTKHSYELWARYVAPRFQRQYDVMTEAHAEVAANRSNVAIRRTEAITQAFEAAGIHLQELVAEQMQRGRT